MYSSTAKAHAGPEITFNFTNDQQRIVARISPTDWQWQATIEEDSLDHVTPRVTHVYQREASRWRVIFPLHCLVYRLDYSVFIRGAKEDDFLDSFSLSIFSSAWETYYPLSISLRIPLASARCIRNFDNSFPRLWNIYTPFSTILHLSFSFILLQHLLSWISFV